MITNITKDFAESYKTFLREINENNKSMKKYIKLGNNGIQNC